MSPLVSPTRSVSAPARPAPTPPTIPPGPDPRTRLIAALPAVAVGAALTLLSFVTAGGDGLGPNTWAEIVLVVLGIAVAGAVVLLGAGVAVHGRAALILFAALAGLTAVSIAWSYAPDVTWLEAGRTAAYLAAFGGALGLARLAPRRWSTLLAGVAIAAVTLSAWAVLVKVFSWPTQGQPNFGRLLAPYAYWNATGLIAAIGLPPMLWAASRRARAPVSRALAIPGLALLIVVVILSYSRSALIAALVGLALPLAFGHTRLRSALNLAIAAAGAAIVCVWALDNASFTGDQVAQAARDSSGHAFGAILAAVLVALAAAGFAAAYLTDRIQTAEQTRRKIGTALVVAAALVPVAAVGGMTASSRGLTGEISHIWGSLTSTQLTIGDSPGRLLSLANSRPRYWRQGLTVGEHHALVGVGAGAFGVAQTRYQTAKLTAANVQHAHSYVVETFADFGLLGVALNLGLLLAWVRASLVTLGRRGSPGQDSPGAQTLERDGSWALFGAVVAFGVSSAIDWTWFYPGVAIPALICAGWLAGRGPLERTVTGPRRMRAGPGAIMASTGLVALAVAAGWAIWQPLRSAGDVDAGLSAIAARDSGAALADANAAASEDPVSLTPLRELATIYTDMGDPARARAEYLKATTVQPQNPEPWLWLGQFELQTDPAAALRALRIAARLDVTNASTQASIGTALSATHLRRPR